MDRSRFSLIAHANHTFANPVGAATIDRVLGLLDLADGQRVLDVGCGNAELLIRLIERHGVVGVGVDPNGGMLARARQQAVARLRGERLILHEAPIADFGAPDGSFDAALCVGASHAYGDYIRTLAALKALVRPGGQILVGEGYWKRDPDPEYLALLDATPDDLTDHAGNVARAAALGLVPLYSVASSDEEWDDYEGLYCRAMERYLAANPDAPDAPEFRAHIRRWYAGYLRWGRSTLGFALYLFQVPEQREQ